MKFFNLCPRLDRDLLQFPCGDEHQGTKVSRCNQWENGIYGRDAASAPKSTASFDAWLTIRGNSPPSLRLSSGASAKKFPYALFFLIESDALLVVACFHSSRDPRLWQKRV